MTCHPLARITQPISGFCATLSLFAGCLAPVLGREYFVGPGGADSGAGTLTRPFKTIQKAASQAMAGDVVTIRAGIYRETVRPAQSGSRKARITFRPAPG